MKINKKLKKQLKRQSKSTDKGLHRLNKIYQQLINFIHDGPTDTNEYFGDKFYTREFKRCDPKIVSKVMDIVNNDPTLHTYINKPHGTEILDSSQAQKVSKRIITRLEQDKDVDDEVVQTAKEDLSSGGFDQVLSFIIPGHYYIYHNSDFETGSVDNIISECANEDVVHFIVNLPYDIKK